MEGVNRVARPRPAFARDMTFERGCERVREQGMRQLGARALRAEGLAARVDQIPRCDLIWKAAELKPAIFRVECLEGHPTSIATDLNYSAQHPLSFGTS